MTLGESCEHDATGDLDARNDGDDRTAVVAVGDDPRQRREQQRGDEQHQADQPEVEGTVRDRVHLPRDGDALDLRTQIDRQRRDDVEPEREAV